MTDLSIWGAVLALGLGLTAAVAASPGDASGRIPADPIVQPARRVPHAAQAALLASTRAGGRIVAVGERGVVMLSDDGKVFRQAREVPVDVTLTAVSFADEKRGWVVGHWGVVLVTRDGGETWQLQRREVREDRPLFSVHFFDAQRGIAVGLWSLVLLTDDGGEHWRAVTLPVPPGAKKADLNLMGLFADVQGRLYAAAEKGMVVWSDDRGQTWSYASTGYKGSLWTGLALPDGVLLTGGLRGALYRSRDRGQTWHRIEQTIPSSVTAMAVCGDGVLVAGLDGLLLRGTRAGESFQPETWPDRASLTSVVMAAEGVPVFFSRGGRVAGPSELKCR